MGGRTGPAVRPGSDLDAEERQHDLAKPHRRRQATGGEGERDGEDAFDADAEVAPTRTLAIVPVRVTATESSDHAVLPGGWGGTWSRSAGTDDHPDISASTG